jgi:predicted kinase
LNEINRCRIISGQPLRGQLSLCAAARDVRRMPKSDDPKHRRLSPKSSASLTDPAAPLQARIHLVLGAVGAGKSSYALRLADEQAAVRLTLDAWMATLFRPDRPDEGVIAWYAERSARCIAQMWALATEMIARRINVILEIGLLAQSERERFYARVNDAGIDLCIHLLDASREVRRARVAARNCDQGETFSMVVPPEIFELASDLWEPPDEAELAGRDVLVIHTDP